MDKLTRADWLALAAIVVGLLGTVPFWYERLIAVPKLHGQLWGVYAGETVATKNGKPTKATAVFMYVSISNAGKTPVYITDYKLEMEVNREKEVLEPSYGLYQMKTVDLDGKQIHIHVSNFSDKLIYANGRPVEYGKPLHGFLVFSTRNSMIYFDSLVKYKLSCLDSFDNEHILTFTSNDVKESGIRMMTEMGGIDIVLKGNTPN